jgi:RsiW-degrading membrane proteinase PrsW (M82 family)
MSIGLYILSLLPCLVILIYVYIRDRYEHERLYIYLLCILFGIFCAWTSYELSILAHAYLKQRNNESLLIKVFIAIALIEESIRFILFRLFLYKNKNFDEPYDGVVYGVTIAMGFAGVENILYLQNYQSVEVALLRMVTTVPAHGLFGAYMGHFIAKAKFGTRFKTFYLILSVCFCTLLHGSYDIFILMKGNPNWIFVSIAILVLFLIYGRKIGSILIKNSPFNK